MISPSWQSLVETRIYQFTYPAGCDKGQPSHENCPSRKSFCRCRGTTMAVDVDILKYFLFSQQFIHSF
jgi:hypothetical protein